MPDIDWARIAVQLALAGDGSYRLLSTVERDQLEAAVEDVRDARRVDDDHRADIIADGMS